MFDRKRRLQFFLVQVLALVFGGALLAEMPKGAYGPFKVNGMPIMDLNVEGLGDTSLTGVPGTHQYKLVMDEKGKITTSGTINIGDTGLGIATADYTGTGKVRAVGGVGKFNLAVKFKGEIIGLPFKMTASYKGDVDLAANTITLAIKARACVKGLGCESIRPDPFIGTLNAGIVNDWTLQLQIGNPKKNRLDGTATVTLDNGRVYTFTDKGSYSPRKDESKLTITSTGYRGNKMTFTHVKVAPEADGGLDGEMAFKISGQKAKSTSSMAP